MKAFLLHHYKAVFLSPPVLSAARLYLYRLPAGFRGKYQYPAGEAALIVHSFKQGAVPLKYGFSPEQETGSRAQLSLHLMAAERH